MNIPNTNPSSSVEESAQPDESTALRTHALPDSLRRSAGSTQSRPRLRISQIKKVKFVNALKMVWRWFEYLEYSRNFGTMTWIYMNYIHVNHVESSSGIPSVIWHPQPCREHPGAVKLTLCHAVSKSSLHFQEHRWIKEVSRYGIQTLKN